MSGLLRSESLERVFSAWRRSIRFDPLLSRVPMPELRPLAVAFNDALTGEDNGALPIACSELARTSLDPEKVVRITTFLAETIADETGSTSGAVTKSLVGTLGHVCGLLMTTMVSDASTDAYRDSLTGLENRRAWDRALNEERERGGSFAVASIDLDGLKQVNDSLGHKAGDALISSFATSLRRGIPDPVRAYRLGGDEFGLFGPRCSLAELEAVLFALAEAAGAAGFSYGVAESAEPDPDGGGVFNIADQRMYEMKRSRRR